MSCGRCEEICYGDVVTVNGKYYHQYCFSCLKCSQDLLEDGFFLMDGEIFCRDDYFVLANTERCLDCNKFVEGEVVEVLDHIFHPHCFGCNACGKLFPPGENIVFDGEGYICEECDQSQNVQQLPQKDISPPLDNIFYEKYLIPSQSQNIDIGKDDINNNHDGDHNMEYSQNGFDLYQSQKYLLEEGPMFVTTNSHQPEEDKGSFVQNNVENNQPGQDQKPALGERSILAAPEFHKPEEESNSVDQRSVSKSKTDGSNNCAGCGNDIRGGQALLALDRQWHLWCFTCNKCGCLLAGEYMGRDGQPYCEDDYQKEFGVTCAGCDGYITGKVLQAGEKHYHPQCSKCAKCHKIFGEGEEMYLQGFEIWHPQCSEEYLKEHEETANEERRREPPSYESTVGLLGNEFNGNLQSAYNGHYNATKRVDHTSIDTFQKYQTYESKGSINKNTWRPQSSYVTSAGRPPGFRSVKPPQPVNSVVSITQSGMSEDEDSPPSVPPPPTRGSNNSWKQRYVPGVYAAKPFQKQLLDTKPSFTTNTAKSNPVSFVESAARKESIGVPIGVNIGEEISPANAPSKGYKKGVGFNKLQLRKLKQQQQHNNIKVNGHQQFPNLNSNVGFSGHEFNKGDPKDKTIYLTDEEFIEVFQ